MENLNTYLKSSLEHILLPDKFLPECDMTKKYSVGRLLLSSNGMSWIRCLDWKWDRVELIVGSSVHINLYTSLLLTDVQREVLIDAVSISNLPTTKATYELPKILFAWRCEHFASKIMGDVNSSYKWFNKTRTVQDCLNRLTQSDRNGVAIGNPLHTQAVEFLKLLN